MELDAAAVALAEVESLRAVGAGGFLPPTEGDEDDEDFRQPLSKRPRMATPAAVESVAFHLPGGWKRYLLVLAG
jgi:hypothetical protein